MSYSDINFTPGLKGYSNVKPFRFWCQKVLPLVYDDSLSYYELLCKVVDYLNNVISDLSATEDNVGELLDAYNQLQDYVNNYFANLDVQEEINNKLDAMFEDGTVPTMIEEYVHPYIEDLNENYAELDEQINETMTAQNTNIANLTARVNNLVVNNTTNLTGYNVVTVESTTAEGGSTVTENIPLSAEILQVYYSGYNDTNDIIKSDNISYESIPNIPSSTQQQVVVTITDSTDTRFNVFITYAISQAIEIAELTDIRVGYDNTVYSSAGNAVRGQVGDLKNDLNDITSSLITLIPQTLTLSVGLMNRYGTASTTDLYENGTLLVHPQERYQIEAFYYGGNFPAIVFLNGTTVVSYINGTDDRTQYTGIVTIPYNVDTMVINGRVADFRSEAYKVRDKKVLKMQSASSIVVGLDANRYEYTDINTAIVDNTDSIIMVDYGTYETEIQNLQTDKKIIGKDADLCILIGTNKDYDTPPIEIAGGIIKNFTVNMINAESAEHKGYCLHSDNIVTANKILHVENCKFSCIGQHAVGIGLRSGETVFFKNCYFEQLDEGADMNPIYIHNSTGADPAIVRFYNCYFKGYEYCMKLQAWGSGNNVQFEFIDCTCYSETYGTTDNCVWTDYVTGSTHDTNRMHEFSGKFTLLASSHGNNVSVLNA